MLPDRGKKLKAASFFCKFLLKNCVDCYNIVKKSCPSYFGNAQLGFNSIEKTTRKIFVRPAVGGWSFF